MQDANGTALAYVYADTNTMVSASYAHEKLSVEQAFLIARWIARLPELISPKT